ncbi:hypothetical protein J8L70_02405 [Pseudoalteromonas sp. MMG010]|uniref:CC0125/CC1285 family lipoprotein n=1 Tax=Pseudoalteromonas sp. MMG010 TaxID=2822685 RepID=UPI001B39DE3B|nr:hypothetical protein [Pseudoalteromonas sp. MMG010]MBQ4832085.1 hypothetical protein [Pseudoalteromonas sp. MMG010]
MQYLMITILILTLTACANSHNSNSSVRGYSEQQLAPDQFALSYKSSRLSKQKVHDFTLLKAAHLTTLHGYDWFVITQQKTEITTPSESFATTHSSASQTTRCGLLSCSTHTSPSYPTASASIQRQQISYYINIKMGTGIQPNAKTHNAYEIQQKESATQYLNQICPNDTRMYNN